MQNKINRTDQIPKQNKHTDSKTNRTDLLVQNKQTKQIYSIGAEMRDQGEREREAEAYL